MKIIAIFTFLVLTNFNQSKRTGCSIRSESCCATDPANRLRWYPSCEYSNLNTGVVNRWPAPEWEMRNPLPNEHRVKVYIEQYRNSSPILSGNCYLLYNEYEYLRLTDLMVRFRIGSSGPWTDAGLAWRIRNYVDGNENDFTRLPGYSHMHSANHHIYRYFYDTTRMLPEQESELRSSTDFQVKLDDVTVDLKTKCYTYAPGFGTCGGICDGYATGSATHRVDLRPWRSRPDMNFPFKFEFFEAKLRKASGKYYLDIGFQREKTCEDISPANPRLINYHFLLIENSEFGGPFRPIIAYHSVKRPSNIHAEFRTSADITEKWPQINLLLKATDPRTAVPDSQQRGACNSFKKTFLGDIYQDWTSKYRTNLAVATSVCITFGDGGFECKPWHKSTEIKWDDDSINDG